MAGSFRQLVRSLRKQAEEEIRVYRDFIDTIASLRAEVARLSAERDALLRFLIHHPNPTMYMPDRDLTRWGFFEPMGAGGIGVWRDFTTYKEAVDALMEIASRGEET